MYFAHFFVYCIYEQLFYNKSVSTHTLSLYPPFDFRFLTFDIPTCQRANDGTCQLPPMTILRRNCSFFVPEDQIESLGEPPAKAPFQSSTASPLGNRNNHSFLATSILSDLNSPPRPRVKMLIHPLSGLFVPQTNDFRPFCREKYKVLRKYQHRAFFTYKNRKISGSRFIFRSSIRSFFVPQDRIPPLSILPVL